VHTCLAPVSVVLLAALAPVVSGAVVLVVVLTPVVSGAPVVLAVAFAPVDPVTVVAPAPVGSVSGPVGSLVEPSGPIVSPSGVVSGGGQPTHALSTTGRRPHEKEL
jgi:hypothetical protein